LSVYVFSLFGFSFFLYLYACEYPDLYVAHANFMVALGIFVFDYVSVAVGMFLVIQYQGPKPWLVVEDFGRAWLWAPFHVVRLGIVPWYCMTKNMPTATLT
jgi:hypothetical protein